MPIFAVHPEFKNQSCFSSLFSHCANFQHVNAVAATNGIHLSDSSSIFSFFYLNMFFPAMLSFSFAVCSTINCIILSLLCMTTCVCFASKDAHRCKRHAKGIVPDQFRSELEISSVTRCNPVFAKGVTLKFLDCSRDRKSTRLNSSHSGESRMPSSA